jgi:hypothetical protein
LFCGAITQQARAPLTYDKETNAMIGLHPAARTALAEFLSVPNLNRHAPFGYGEKRRSHDQTNYSNISARLEW